MRNSIEGWTRCDVKVYGLFVIINFIEIIRLLNGEICNSLKVYTFLSTTKIPNRIGFFSSRFLKRCAVRTDSLIYSCNIFCKRLEIDTCSSISSDFKKLDKVKRIIAFVYSLFYKNTLKLSNSLHIHKKKATLSKLHINSWYVIQWVFVYFWRGYKWMGRKKIYS